MIPEPILIMFLALGLIAFGMFLAWIWFRFHVLPNNYIRRRHR
jgi:hypothetical protein